MTFLRSVFGLFGLLLVSGPAAGGPPVRVLRLPDGGMQPQTATDAAGIVHLVYLAGDPGAADVFYARLAPGAESIAQPVRVNDRRGSAIATGTVRGAHIALGRDGRVFVAWMGSKEAEPRAPGGAAPMLVARTESPGGRFEPERNVLQHAVGLDGGGSIAADGAGNVYVVWHGGAPGRGEVARRIWMARSRDDGRTFASEVAVDPGATGVCGCCGMRAFADAAGRLYMLYRAATEEVHRDMVLLRSEPGGAFASARVSEWNIKACPMSTASIAPAGARVLGAWESQGQVYFGTLGSRSGETPQSIVAPGESGKRRHPAVAGNERGETLLAWTEGTGWQRGGRLAWQLFDAAGRAIGPMAETPGVPVWGLPAVAPQPGGGFVLVY